MMSSIVEIRQSLRNVNYKLKGSCLRWYLLLHGCTVGRGLRCVRFPSFRLIPNGNIEIGNNVTVGDGIVFEVLKGASLVLGDGVNLTHNIILAVNKKLVIGDHTLIAENVSLRDGGHEIKKDRAIVQQDTDSDSIHIAEDVWIGANSVILKGSKIPKGCVIGANSLVISKCELDPYKVYAGSPAKLIKSRH